MTHFDETTEQLKARRMLAALIEAFRLSPNSAARQQMGRQIRDISRNQPWLADQLPSDVYQHVYRVGRSYARGTEPPNVSGR